MGKLKTKMPIDISCNLAGHELSNCIYNASGARCMLEEELDNLQESEAGAYVSKSCTLEYREGNPSPRYVENSLGSINSMGLPNEGVTFYAQYADKASAKSEKPFFMSVAGLSLEENLAMLTQLKDSNGVAAVELNLSCPNVPGKPQTGYDFERTDFVLEQVFKVYEKPLGVKLPPYFDLIHFDQMAQILNRYPLSFVTCVNSIGNGLVIDVANEEVVIKPKGGFGGIGGDYIKPTALANVRKFYELLNSSIKVIGCGGVKSGSDVFEHILCGAEAVQVGTQLMKEGADCFKRIKEELKELMNEKGYSSLEEFRGKLKSI